MKAVEIVPRLLVENPRKCFEFYIQNLGYEPLWDDGGNVYLSCCLPGENVPVIAFFAKSHMIKYEGYTDIGQQIKSDYAIITLSVDDLDGCYHELKAKGVEFMGEPRNMPDWTMRCVMLRDPEGNLIELSGPLQES
ncbi:MAG: VOC family protein [Anaerolineae bacterium]|nr:VOC family protein [Anaerolineae bacterium]